MMLHSLPLIHLFSSLQFRIHRSYFSAMPRRRGVLDNLAEFPEEGEILGNLILPIRRWVQRHAGAPKGRQHCAAPTSANLLFIFRLVQFHGSSFLGYPKEGSERGRRDARSTSANTSFLFPPVPHPRELLLYDAQAERGFGILIKMHYYFRFPQLFPIYFYFFET